MQLMICVLWLWDMGYVEISGQTDVKFVWIGCGDCTELFEVLHQWKSSEQKAQCANHYYGLGKKEYVINAKIVSGVSNLPPETIFALTTSSFLPKP